jgi:hypothetical protein
MLNPYEKIIQLLEAGGAEYEVFEHEPVYTSEQAAKVDNFLSENEFISFNPGVHTKTIKMKWKDYQLVVKPEMADISK